MQAQRDERAHFMAVLGGQPLLHLLAVDGNPPAALADIRRHRMLVVRPHQEDMGRDRGVGAVLVLAQFGVHHEMAQEEGEVLLLPVVRHQHLDSIDEARRVLKDLGFVEIDPGLAYLHARHDAGNAAGIVRRHSPALEIGDDRTLEVVAGGADSDRVGAEAMPVVADDLLLHDGGVGSLMPNAAVGACLAGHASRAGSEAGRELGEGTRVLAGVFGNGAPILLDARVLVDLGGVAVVEGELDVGLVIEKSTAISNSSETRVMRSLPNVAESCRS
jgi:hypothetical protein